MFGDVDKLLQPLLPLSGAKTSAELEEVKQYLLGVLGAMGGQLDQQQQGAAAAPSGQPDSATQPDQQPSSSTSAEALPDGGAARSGGGALPAVLQPGGRVSHSSNSGKEQGASDLLRHFNAAAAAAAAAQPAPGRGGGGAGASGGSGVTPPAAAAQTLQQLLGNPDQLTALITAVASAATTAAVAAASSQQQHHVGGPVRVIDRTAGRAGGTPLSQLGGEGYSDAAAADDDWQPNRRGAGSAIHLTPGNAVRFHTKSPFPPASQPRPLPTHVVAPRVYVKAGGCGGGDVSSAPPPLVTFQDLAPGRPGGPALPADSPASNVMSLVHPVAVEYEAGPTAPWQAIASSGAAARAANPEAFELMRPRQAKSAAAAVQPPASPRPAAALQGPPAAAAGGTVAPVVVQAPAQVADVAAAAVLSTPAGLSAAAPLQQQTAAAAARAHPAAASAHPAVPLPADLATSISHTLGLLRDPAAWAQRATEPALAAPLPYLPNPKDEGYQQALKVRVL